MSNRRLTGLVALLTGLLALVVALVPSPPDAGSGVQVPMEDRATDRASSAGGGPVTDPAGLKDPAAEKRESIALEAGNAIIADDVPAGDDPFLSMSIELRPTDQAGHPVDMGRLGTDAYLHVWQEQGPGNWLLLDKRWAVQGAGLRLPSVLLGVYRFELRAGDGFHVIDASRPRAETRTGDVFGTALSNRIVLDEAGAGRTVQLPFRGSGVLSGRLEDESGEPVRGMSLLAVEEGEPFSDSTGRPKRPRRPASPGTAFQASGLGEVLGVTDDSGRFSFRGLRPGPFHVLEASTDGLQIQRRLSDAPLEADGRVHALVVESGARIALEVEVLDDSGARRTDLEVWSPSDGETHPPQLGKRVRVWVEPDPQAEERLAVNPASLPQNGRELAMGGNVTSDGLVRFSGLQAGRYRVLCASRRHGLVTKDVTMEPASRPPRVTLRLPIASQSASLTVQLLGTDGRSLRGSTHVGLTERSSGRRLAGTTVDSLMGAARAKLVVPPGEYWVDVTDLPTFDGPDGSVDARGRGAGRVPVTLAPEAKETLRFQIPEPARIEVLLSGVAPPLSSTAANASGPTSRLFHQEAARIELHRGSESPVLVWFYSEGSVAGVPGTHEAPAMLNMIPLDRTWTSEPLPEGRFDAVAVLTDGRRAAASVELRDGQTSRVHFDFQ